MVRMIPKITLIRNYIKAMLKQHVDIGGRVFFGRPNSPLFREEMPCINVHFGEEPAEVLTGSAVNVREYKKTCDLVLTVVAENNTTDDYPEAIDAENTVDIICYQIEEIFKADNKLAKQLPDYDPNTNFLGLSYGCRLISSTVYDVDTEAEKAIVGKVLRYEVPYLDHGWPDKRFPEFINAIFQFVPGEAYDFLAPPVPQGTESVFVDFDYTNFESTMYIGSIPADRFAAYALILVFSPFDTGAATIGDAIAPARLMVAVDNDLTFSETYISDAHYLYDNIVETYVHLTGTPTVGSGRAVIYYW